MNPDPKDPQLTLKATPPRVSKTLLGRPRLSSNSPELADKSVILVQAPSGLGKTSLLAQWRREALQSGSVAAWLSLDERDDATRFAQGLGVSMRIASGRSDFGQSYVHTVGVGGGDLETLTNWLAEVADMGVEVVLFLDDAHALPESTVDPSLMYLLHNAPANLKVILAARKQIVLPVADMLAHGRFAALDSDALRFRLEETIAVITARFGSRADSDACVRLHDLTEGWPLGLQLAIATIEKSLSLSEAIAAFSVRAGDIQRYFVECLVERLSRPLADFLIRISIVDSLHPDLCEAITGCVDSDFQLKRLQDATPIFLAGVDSDWLRIHPLAREFLKDRFEMLPVEERQAVHGRAAHWLAERQMYQAAARQALRAGQDQLAYEFAARCLYDVLMTGEVAQVWEWVERLPACEVEKRPRLLLAVGWALAMSERHAEAAQLVGRMIDAPTSDPGDRCESAEICAAAAFYADDMEGMERMVEPWFDSLPTRPAVLRTVGINMLAMLTLFRGMPEQARYLYQQLAQDHALTIGGYARGWSDWVIGISYLWQGQVFPAEETLRASLARAEEECGRRSPTAVMLASALAAVLWERGLTDEVEALLANRLDVLERRAPPDAIIIGFVIAARVATLRGLERRAFDLLENLYALGTVRGLPRLCVASLTEQIRMHALRSHGEVCSTLIGRLDGVTTPQAYERWDILGPLVEVQVGLARAYFNVVRHDWRQVLSDLKAIDPIAKRLRRVRDRIQIALLLALAMKRCGEDGATMLNEAISLAETMGLERVLVDTHPDLVDWARRVRSEVDGPESTAIQRPVPTPGLQVARQVNAHVFPSALLTPKERDVVQLLAGNLTNKEIALALGVSDETVKWHLKNLFDKLNALNRKHLLVRARMLGILDAVA